jgi:hypothetical protein
MISFGYDQIIYHEDKCLTYQGTYIDAYFTQLYVIDQTLKYTFHWKEITLVT